MKLSISFSPCKSMFIMARLAIPADSSAYTRFHPPSHHNKIDHQPPRHAIANRSRGTTIVLDRCNARTSADCHRRNERDQEKSNGKLLLPTLFLGGGSCGLFLLILTSQSVSLGLDTFLSSFTGGLGLGTFGVHLVFEDTFTLFLGFGFVDLVVLMSVI